MPPKPVVEGYEFVSGGEELDSYNGFVCQIIGRAGTDADLTESGPKFLVRFADGEEFHVFGSELTPWYPV